MSFFIVLGEDNKAEVESEIDIFAELIGGDNDADFFGKYYVKGKSFPGGPNCNFRGK